MRNIDLPKGIVIAGALISVSIFLTAAVFAPRYSFMAVGGVVRLDLRSGEVVICGPDQRCSVRIPAGKVDHGN